MEEVNLDMSNCARGGMGSLSIGPVCGFDGLETALRPRNFPGLRSISTDRVRLLEGRLFRLLRAIRYSAVMMRMRTSAAAAADMPVTVEDSVLLLAATSSIGEFDDDGSPVLRVLSS
jgi:hypothetical protein